MNRAISKTKITGFEGGKSNSEQQESLNRLEKKLQQLDSTERKNLVDALSGAENGQRTQGYEFMLPKAKDSIEEQGSYEHPKRNETYEEPTFYDKLNANDNFSVGGERNLYKLGTQGGRVSAAYTEGHGKKRTEDKDQINSSTAAIEHVTPTTPQVAETLQKSKVNIDNFCTKNNIDQSAHNEDFLAVVLYYNNQAINETWPTQNDQLRGQLIKDAQANNNGEIKKGKAEDMGATVCVNKAACQHFLLNHYSVGNAHMQDIKNYQGKDEGHMNNVITTPTHGIQECNAGSNPEWVMDNNKIKMIELLEKFSQN